MSIMKSVSWRRRYAQVTPIRSKGKRLLNIELAENAGENEKCQAGTLNTKVEFDQQVYGHEVSRKRKRHCTQSKKVQRLHQHGGTNLQKVKYIRAAVKKLTETGI